MIVIFCVKEQVATGSCWIEQGMFRESPSINLGDRPKLCYGGSMDQKDGCNTFSMGKSLGDGVAEPLSLNGWEQSWPLGKGRGSSHPTVGAIFEKSVFSAQTNPPTGKIFCERCIPFGPSSQMRGLNSFIHSFIFIFFLENRLFDPKVAENGQAWNTFQPKKWSCGGINTVRFRLIFLTFFFDFASFSRYFFKKWDFFWCAGNDQKMGCGYGM